MSKPTIDRGFLNLLTRIREEARRLRAAIARMGARLMRLERLIGRLRARIQKRLQQGTGTTETEIRRGPSQPP